MQLARRRSCPTRRHIWRGELSAVNRVIYAHAKWHWPTNLCREYQGWGMSAGKKRVDIAPAEASRGCADKDRMWAHPAWT
jgi:hypothetical protein